MWKLTRQFKMVVCTPKPHPMLVPLALLQFDENYLIALVVSGTKLLAVRFVYSIFFNKKKALSKVMYYSNTNLRNSFQIMEYKFLASCTM